MSPIPIGSDSDQAQQIRELLQEFREAVEQQDWPRLNAVVGSRHVWLNDRMVTLEEFASLLDDLLKGKIEVDILFHDLLCSEISENRAKVGFRTKFLAEDPETWEETEEEFDMHVGFEREGRDRWSLSYLGFTEPETPTTQGGQTAIPDLEAIDRYIDRYIDRPPIPRSLTAGDAGGLMPVYMPFYLPTSLIAGQVPDTPGGDQP